MKSFVLVFISLVVFSCTDGVTESTNSKESEISLDFTEKTIANIHSAYDEGTLTAEKVVKEYLDQIESIDRSGPELNSIIAVNPDALEIAKALDSDWKAGNKKGPLHGIPILLKDNIDTHDKMPTTAGSLALKNSFPSKDAFLVERLREAGAIILGKANLSEWANFRGELSSSGWSAVGGQVKNPYDITRNPCGSSSGSGVAVSANLTMLAIGTETNGSIVCPSSLNGIVGIKPTVGLISRSGIIPISFTQDTPGPMARTVTDAAICLGTLIGVDPKDSKTAISEGKALADYTPFLKKDGMVGKRIGFYTGPIGTNFKVDELMNKNIELLKEMGAEIIEINEIAPPETGSLSFQVMLYEYKDGLNHYFASLGEESPIKSLDDLITFNRNAPEEMEFYNQKYLEMANEMESLDSEGYIETLEALRRSSQDEGIDRVMDLHNLDAIVSPTGTPAWKTDHVIGDHYQLSSSSPAAQSGYPNVTVPMGYVAGLPVGISFFGRAWSEPVLIEIAYAYEQASQHRQAPEFLSEAF